MEGFYGGTWESRCRKALPSQAGVTSVSSPVGQGNTPHFTPSVQRGLLLSWHFTSSRHIENFEQRKLTFWNPVFLLHQFCSHIGHPSKCVMDPPPFLYAFCPIYQPNLPYLQKQQRAIHFCLYCWQQPPLLLRYIHCFIFWRPCYPPIPQHGRAHELRSTDMPPSPIFCWDIKISEPG